MSIITYERVPASLKLQERWLLHKAKVPYQTNGKRASSTNPKTWTDYDTALAALRSNPNKFDGLGFALGDGFAGIDLDDCREPITGEIKRWAQEIIDNFDCYWEVSPSETGLKGFCLGQVPKGKKKEIEGGAVEVYSDGRYFTVTGERYAGEDVTDCQSELDELYHSMSDKGGSDEANCRAALASLPEAIEGDRGHDKAYRAAREIFRYGLDGEKAQELLHWYNENKCYPPFDQGELDHKFKQAREGALQERDFGVKAKPKSGEFTLEALPWSAFNAIEFNQRFIVDKVLVAGEHLVIGGPKKSLKTSISLDLAVSLATATPFLGQFEVPEPTSVWILSGESGGPTLQKTVQRICEARGLKGPSDKLIIGRKLPQLSQPEQLDALRRLIRLEGIEVALIDPAYLCTLGVATANLAGNVFAMGSLLKGLGEVATDTGCTLGIVHHARKKSGKTKGERYGRPELDDLSQSGWAEWMRQWIILNQRSRMQDGRHELWGLIGGSAGHNGEYAIDVDEGKPDDPLIGQRWDVRVYDAEEAKNSREVAKEESSKVLQSQVLSTLMIADKPLTRNGIITELGGKNDKSVLSALEILLATGQVSRVPGGGYNGRDGYSIAA